MSDDQEPYPIGETLFDGRFVFTELLAGHPLFGLWRGRQMLPVSRGVFITFVCRRLHDDAIRNLKQRVPGVPEVLFVGPPDGHEQPEQPGPGWKNAVVHPSIEGRSLSAIGTIRADDAVRIGVSLCDLVLAWSVVGPINGGLRPGTVYVTGDPGHRRFSGAIPHTFLILGNQPGDSPFTYDWYMPPSDSAGVSDVPLDDIVFTLGLIIWRAMLGSHPYELGDGSQVDDNMWEDRRKPFSGPAELGQLLERVLVADVDARMKTDEFRAGLVDLARAWNVELSSFPPPGLSPKESAR